jgi:dihydrofolate reductase
VTEQRDGPVRVISLIVAMDRQRAIGYEGKLPWHIPADLKRFRELTMGHHIVMGRRTYESIGRPLPGRTSVIVTHRVDYAAPGAIVAHSVEEALACCSGDAEVFVIGGAQLYREALPLAERVYLTEIDGAFPADTWFPELPPDQWRESAREHRPEPGAGYRGFDYVTLERVAPALTARRSG